MGSPPDRELDVEAPNESAPGHNPTDAGDVGSPQSDTERPHDDALDVEAPNESAPGHNPGGGA